MKIVSFLPAATEMACALGLEDQMVGVTHECDYPDAVRAKPVVVSNALALETMGIREIDRVVSERLRSGASLYKVDEQLIRDLNPDLILTQDLCQVCAPSGNEVTRLLASLPRPPEILWMTPRGLLDIDQNLRDLGRITGRLEAAERLIAAGRARLGAIKARTETLRSRPRVFCMEWVDPIYCTGHWVPEMVFLAGGDEGLGRPGSDSMRVSWEAVLDWDPDVLVVMPCGFKLGGALEQAAGLVSHPGWEDISAVRQGRVFAVDANAYFARPGPRVVDGVELLAHLIHPKLFSWNGQRDAFAALNLRHLLDLA